MPTSQDRSKYEESLSRAHRALYWAQHQAEANGDDGAVEDLQALMEHVSVMLSDSIKNRRRPRRQLSVVDS